MTVHAAGNLVPSFMVIKQASKGERSNLAKTSLRISVLANDLARQTQLNRKLAALGVPAEVVARLLV